MRLKVRLLIVMFLVFSIGGCSSGAHTEYIEKKIAVGILDQFSPVEFTDFEILSGQTPPNNHSYSIKVKYCLKKRGTADNEELSLGQWTLRSTEKTCFKETAVFNYTGQSYEYDPASPKKNVI